MPKCPTCGVKVRSDWVDVCVVCGTPLPEMPKKKKAKK